jgi:hypothetical protein
MFVSVCLSIHSSKEQVPPSGPKIVVECKEVNPEKSPSPQKSSSPSPPARPRHLTRASPKRSPSRCSVSRSRRVFAASIKVGMAREDLEHVYSADLRKWLIEQGDFSFLPSYIWRYKTKRRS